METITEEMKVHEEWYEKANKVTMKELPKFLNHLMEDYGHDYGTIVHALTAGGLASMHAMNAHENGGITSFQAGCVMWQFIQKWMHYDCPLKLVIYEDMLYPQYEEKFNKTISSDTWKWLQKEAKKKLEDTVLENAHPNVVKHWESIRDGVVPFGFVVSDKE